MVTENMVMKPTHRLRFTAFGIPVNPTRIVPVKRRTALTYSLEETYAISGTTNELTSVTRGITSKQIQITVT